MKNPNMKGAGRRAWRTRFQKLGLPDWHATEAAGLLPNKEEERKLILDFLFEHHPEYAPFHSLTLPGSRFCMERTIARKRKDAQFTCLERSRKFLRVAFSTFSARSPGGKLKQAERLVGHRFAYRNRKVRLLNIKAGELSQVELDTPLTAIWYDGMGLLNAEDFRLFAESLPGKLTTDHPVPAVFTVMLGRDAESFYEGVPGNTEGKRARRLVLLLKAAGLSFDLKTFWSYRSDAGKMRMLNICGLLAPRRKRKRSGRPSHQWDNVTLNEFRALRNSTSATALAAVLGLTVNTVSQWGKRYAPDDVAQAELARLIATCQAMAPRSP